MSDKCKKSQCASNRLAIRTQFLASEESNSSPASFPPRQYPGNACTPDIRLPTSLDEQVGGDRLFQLTAMVFSTSMVPGAAQAMEPASSLSSHELTFPLSFTIPPCAVTLIVKGSNHDRSNATMILSLMSDAFGFGLIAISLETPMTPQSPRMSLAAASCW